MAKKRLPASTVLKGYIATVRSKLVFDEDEHKGPLGAFYRLTEEVLTSLESNKPVSADCLAEVEAVRTHLLQKLRPSKTNPEEWSLEKLAKTACMVWEGSEQDDDRQADGYRVYDAAGELLGRFSMRRLADSYLEMWREEIEQLEQHDIVFARAAKLDAAGWYWSWRDDGQVWSEALDWYDSLLDAVLAAIDYVGGASRL